MCFKNYYTSGEIEITQADGKNRHQSIVNERFETRKELRKLIFRLSKTNCIVTVRFDNIDELTERKV